MATTTTTKSLNENACQVLLSILLNFFFFHFGFGRIESNEKKNNKYILYVNMTPPSYFVLDVFIHMIDLREKKTKYFNRGVQRHTITHKRIADSKVVPKAKAKKKN